MTPKPFFSLSRLPRARRWRAAALAGLLACAGGVLADESGQKLPLEIKPKLIKEPLAKEPVAGEISATSASSPKTVGAQLREALGMPAVPNKKLVVNVASKPAVASEHPAAAPVARASREAQPARAEAMNRNSLAEAHWDYEGPNGPETWGKLKPEFSLCAVGKRQSPINIDESTTLQGPAEALGFAYKPSNATVVNTGHTIQVDVQGSNTLTVRGSVYRLVQLHFHTPSEEQINAQSSAMVAHLVHRNDQGQLAVVAVMLQPGNASPFIDKVWTYMPLDAGDRVAMPGGLLDVSELLPADPRYYQYMGSLTTPPCSENVLWMVMKQPVQISKAQHRLFTQLYPSNARPVQALNGRPVRDAQ